MQATIRPVKISDYSAVNAIGTANYSSNYYEGAKSFESKMAGYPEGCFVADVDGVVGYVISFPYVLGKPYPLNELFTPTPNPDCYYIHDVCVAPEFRGKGIAKQLAERVFAADWDILCLVAVQKSNAFWRKLGFRGFAALEYYGQKAEYMLWIRD